jgi:hypothetical protein
VFCLVTVENTSFQSHKSLPIFYNHSLIVLNYSNDIMNLKKTQMKFLLIRDGSYTGNNTECGGQHFEHSL